MKWLRLRNQLASHRIVAGVRSSIPNRLAPSRAYRFNCLGSLQEALTSETDGYWRFSHHGQFSWDSLNVRCINQAPSLAHLPWWWYRNTFYPALSVLTLNNALAYQENAIWIERGQPRAGDVWSERGEAIPEVFRPHHPQPCAPQTAVPGVRSRATRLAGVYLYLGWLSMHYGHFLLETLAHCWPLTAAGLDRSAVKLAAFLIEDDIPRKRPRFLMRTLEQLGVELEDISLIHDPVIFERLLVPTPSIFMGKNAYTTPAQLKIWDALREKSDRATKAVYLSRRKYRLWGQIRRPLGNEEEVESLFRRHGFKIVFPETLTFDEQLDLFGQCAVLAGTIGSNMHNAAFMPPGGQVLIIAPSSFATPMDALINGPKGITTHYFFVDVPGMTFDSQEVWSVDVEKLDQLLANTPALKAFNSSSWSEA